MVPENTNKAADNEAKQSDSTTGLPHVDNIENIEKVEIRRSLFDYLSYLPAIVVGLIGIIVLAGICYALFYPSQSSLFNFGDARSARGLITFLVAFVTIAIAMILTLSAVLSNSPDLKDRFAMGKEVLTILIGVLGTIVGFYFGSADKTPIVNVNPLATEVGAAQILQISMPNLSSTEITGNSGITISSFISGGKTPYQYKITFDPPIIDIITNQTSDGIIKAEVKKPELGITKDTEITYQIDVTDAENKTAVLTKDKVKKFVIKNQ